MAVFCNAVISAAPSAYAFRNSRSNRACCVGNLGLRDGNMPALPLFYPHYLAAYTCVIALLVVRGIMVLYGWPFQGRRVGRWLALFIILGGLFNEPLAINSLTALHAPGPNSREFIHDKLKSMGGTHVVFVRYDADHDSRTSGCITRPMLMRLPLSGADGWGLPRTAKL